MTSPLKANDALDEAREAAEAEGIFEPNADEAALLKRYGVLKSRKGAIVTEMDAIETKIFNSMKDRGARALTRGGKNLALISPTNTSKFDMKAFKAAYAALAAQFTTREAGERKAIKV
mgnify:CR=1 FL=1